MLSASLLLFNAVQTSAVDGDNNAKDTPEGRAVVSNGDLSRLIDVLTKARRGDAITVAVIGGSITEGASAARGKNYAALIDSWWRKTFPNNKITFINAGIGATNSNYGSLRANRDLLSRNPDFVVVEYAVNDKNTKEAAETLEGLIRQILKQPNNPAVVLLFMMNKDGSNAQEWFTKVGTHYNLPMLSYRDALWPEIKSGKMKWEEISPDTVHPNDRGHAYAAGLVNAMLQRSLDSLPAERTVSAITVIPAPLLTDLYEFTELREGESLKPVANTGWVYDAKLRCWKSETPGSVIEFKIDGTVIVTLHYVIKGPMGRASVTIDGGKPRKLDGWFDKTWGGYRQSNIIGNGLAQGAHSVRFELLPEKSEGSTGNEFRIVGLGAAGLPKK
jgi:lysophospholipase L1-like esterase